MKAQDGKMRETDTLDTKGILRLIESVPSSKAEPFKVWLANLGSERIDEVFDPELYGDNTDKMIFENNKFECFLVGNPRADGHTAISTKTHYKDMMKIDDETCNEIFVLAKKIMNILKDIYNAESVYFCTILIKI